MLARAAYDPLVQWLALVFVAFADKNAQQLAVFWKGHVQPASMLARE
jgi:hypothetical protein